MTHTVIGFFRNSEDAFRASDILRDKGFGIDNVDVMSNTSDSDRSDSGEKRSKIGDFFRSLFSDDEKDADRYSNFASNNSIVTVHASNSDEAERAADILDSCGAIDIDEGGGYSGSEDRFTDTDYTRNSDFNDFDSRELDEADFDPDRPQKNYHREIEVNDTDRAFSSDRDLNLRDESDFEREIPFAGDTDEDRFSRDRDFDETTEKSIPVYEEDVNVGKREVRRGGVRVRSRIISRPVEETLRLREEHVHVERTPVDREVTDADMDNFNEDTVEVHAYGEEPVVSKRSRVVEEVKVGKKVHERKETIRERARKTEIDIENLDADDKPVDTTGKD